MSAQLSLFAARRHPDPSTGSTGFDYGADVTVLLEEVTAKELRLLARHAPGRHGRSEEHGVRTLTFAFSTRGAAEAFADSVYALTLDTLSHEITARTEPPPPPKTYPHHCELCGTGCNRLILEVNGKRGLCGACAK